MWKYCVLFAVFVLFQQLAGLERPAMSQGFDYDYYTVAWNTPSKDETGNMPLGNGRFAASVWVVEDGDLMMYLAHQEAHSELQSLLKLGRVRIHMDPNPFLKGKPFEQTLRLRDGCIEIAAGDKDATVRLQILIDKGADVLYVTGTSDKPVTVTATLENWRGERRDVSKGWRPNKSNLYARIGCPPDKAKCWESADQFPDCADGLLWFHRNAHSAVPVHVREQNLADVSELVPDPLVNNTFGGLIAGSGFSKRDTFTLVTEMPITAIDLRVAAHVEQTATAEEWIKAIRNTHKMSAAPTEAKTRTAEWWREFFDRSWVFIEGDPSVVSQPVPRNALPLRFGADSKGGSLLFAEVAEAAVFNRPLSPDEIGKLAAKEPGDTPPIVDGLVTALSDGQDNDFINHDTIQTPAGVKLDGGWLEMPATAARKLSKGMTCAGWFKLRDNVPNAARFFDKCTPGSGDGFSLMIYDRRLRLAVGHRNHVWSPVDSALETDQWHHVALTVDDRTGLVVMYLDGLPTSPLPEKSNHEVPSRLTQSYVLSRAVQAMQDYSAFPAYFQGGLYTVDPTMCYWHGMRHKPEDDLNADYRFFGCNYWWQNSRALYWPQAVSGDYESLLKFIDFFVSKTELWEERARRYYNARGVYFTECPTIFGLPAMCDWGWDSDKHSSAYIDNIWQQALELAELMFDYYDHTQDKRFLTDKLIPWATKCLEFYDTRFPKDKNGNIRITPTHAVESFWFDVVNDMPSVAGLHDITKRLLELPVEEVTIEQRAYWQKIHEALPPIPKRIVEGRTVPDHAESYDPRRMNYEAPDLYCVQPFRIYGLGRKDHDVEEAREAWRRMDCPVNACWYQTGIFAAHLGLVDGARRDVLARSGLKMINAATDKPVRFPGYFDTPHDYPPCLDHAGNLRMVLQTMLLQEGERNEILLLPAWPSEWDTRFKLRAPQNTVVECEVRDGKVVKLEVTPRSRRRDVRQCSTRE